jgi:hypothetical protein
MKARPAHIILAFWLLAIVVGEARADWPPLGLPVARFVGPQIRPQVESDGQNGAFVVWFQSVYPFVQDITRAGEPAAGWPDIGVVPPPRYDPRVHWRITPVGHVADGEGGVYLLSAQSEPCLAQCGGGRAGPLAVHRLVAGGASASGWPDEGLLVFDDQSDDFAYLRSKLVKADDHGVIILDAEWETRFGIPVAKRVRLQAIAPDGSRRWGPRGVQIATGLELEELPALLADDQGGAFVFWGERDSTTNTFSIRSQHVSHQGRLLWGASGRVISNSNFGSLNGPFAAGDGDHGAMVAWASGSAVATDLHVAHVVREGELPWMREQLLRRGAGGASDLQLAPTKDGGAIASWLELGGARERGVYAQRISKQGRVAWALDGVLVSTSVGNQPAPRIASDGHGGAYIAWQGPRPTGKLFATRLDERGVSAPGWPAGGAVISPWQDAEGNSTSSAEGPYLTATGRDEAIVAWDASQPLLTQPSGATVEQAFVMLLRPNGPAASTSPSGGDPRLAEDAGDTSRQGPAELAVEAMHANPVTGAWIRFALPDWRPATLEQFDLEGRRLWSRDIGALGPGTHEARLRDGAWSPPGLYLIRLRQGTHVATTKVVVGR